MIYLQLLWCYVQVGVLSIGGGGAAMPIIRGLVVDGYGWLSAADFSDLVTISEMTPGPIILNSATFVGMKMAGVPGAVVTTFGAVLPSLIIVLTLAYFYKRFRDTAVFSDIMSGLRPLIAALVTSAGVGLAVTAMCIDSSVDYVGAALFAVSLFVLRKWKPNPIWLILGSGAVGTVCYLLIL